MKVTMMNGTVEEKHVLQCHGYRALSVELGNKDLAALHRMPPEQRLATLAQITYRFYRVGNPEFDEDNGLPF